MRAPTTMAIYNRLAGLANRALQSVSSQIRVAAANLWRDHYNPLRGLTMRRAVALLEDDDRGAYADLQWTYRAIERQDETLGALIERRTSAINQLDWDIKLRDDIPQEKREVAARQARALRAAYERIDNLTDALEALAMASFRGFAHLEKVEDAAGRIHRLELVPQWHWVREGVQGEWRLNPRSQIGTTRGEPVDLRRFVVREVDRPINRVALICHVRKGLSQKDWDAYVEEFGIPAVFVILPENVPADQLEQYEAAADKVTSNSRGMLPGGSKVETVTGEKNGEPFEKHLERQDKVLVLRGTGGLLTMLSAPGSGTLAGSAHMQAFEMIARAEAARISEILQRQFDRQILDAETPGEQRWAYFELASQEEQDPAKIVEAVTMLEGAGLRVDEGWIAEETGYPVRRAEAGGTEGCAHPLRGLAAASQEENGVRTAAGRETAPESISGAIAKNRRSTESAPPDEPARDWLDEAAETALTAALEGGGAESLEAALTDAAGRAVEVIRNAGTSDGSRKGWETRRRNGWTPKRVSAEAAKGKAAVAAVLDTGTDALSAFEDPDLGEIDLRAGNSKGGLIHIAEKHGRQIAEAMPEMILSGAKSDGKARAFVDGERGGEPYRVVLAKDFFGEPSNHWVVTAYTKPQKKPGEPAAG